jgi:endoglucanase
MKKLFLVLLIPLLWVSCPTGDSSGVKISLDKKEISLSVGKTRKLTATVTDAKNKAVTWTTSDASIATVSGGTVTAVAIGEATITAESKEDAGKTAQCAVTVKPPLAKGDIGAKDGLSGNTAAEYFDEHNVYIGWNLGNGFDAGGGYGDWTRKIDETFLPKVAEAGFSMIRIPVTWNTSSRPIGGAPDYKIDPAIFTELVQVVDWAYGAGLVTIINIHHDSWLSLRPSSDLVNDSKRDAVYAQFEKVWGQIADKFKDYGDWLIFEPFNELHNGDWGNSIIPGEQAIVNELNKRFTETVRKSGGKNAQRFLVVQPVCAKPNQAMDDGFKIPADTAKDKQIVSIHYYLPEAFALNGNNNTITWGSAGDKNSMSGNFERYAAKFTQKGIPVILGESGATYQNRTDATASATAAASRIVYMDYMCREAKKNGIIPVYWDNGTIMASSVGENFGLWDRRKEGGTLELFDECKDVLEAMINAVK